MREALRSAGGSTAAIARSFRISERTVYLRRRCGNLDLSTFRTRTRAVRCGCTGGADGMRSGLGSRGQRRSGWMRRPRAWNRATEKRRRHLIDELRPLPSASLPNRETEWPRRRRRAAGMRRRRTRSPSVPPRVWNSRRARSTPCRRRSPRPCGRNVAGDRGGTFGLSGVGDFSRRGCPAARGARAPSEQIIA